MYSQFSYSDSVLNQIFLSHAQRDIENIAQQMLRNSDEVLLFSNL